MEAFEGCRRSLIEYARLMPDSLAAFQRCLPFETRIVALSNPRPPHIDSSVCLVSFIAVIILIQVMLTPR